MRLLGHGVEGAELLLLILPLTIGAANLSTHDQSGNVVGQDFATTVFAQLPQNAVLGALHGTHAPVDRSSRLDMPAAAGRFLGRVGVSFHALAAGVDGPCAGLLGRLLRK